MPGPLAGIKVVEMGVWVAGPAAGCILADWGADVVKIEPPAGDPARSFQQMLGGRAAQMVRVRLAVEADHEDAVRRRPGLLLAVDGHRRALQRIQRGQFGE